QTHARYDLADAANIQRQRFPADLERQDHPDRFPGTYTLNEAISWFSCSIEPRRWMVALLNSSSAAAVPRTPEATFPIASLICSAPTAWLRMPSLTNRKPSLRPDTSLMICPVWPLISATRPTPDRTSSLNLSICITPADTASCIRRTMFSMSSVATAV